MKSLERVAQDNKKLLRGEHPEPERGGPATVVSLFECRPATVISVEPRRCIVQLDSVLPITISPSDYLTSRNEKGKLFFFSRRLNSKKWNFKPQHGETELNLVPGVRISRQPDISNG